MNKLVFSALAASLLLSTGSMSAQYAKTAKQVKKETYKEYSRWSIGANIGLPFTNGDMTSFSDDKLYFGVIGGLQLTYQINPTFGITLSGDAGTNKAGHKSYESEFVLNPDATTFLGYPTVAKPANALFFNELYTQERYALAGLHLDVNVLNIFNGNRQATRRWTMLLSPAVYAQKFSPRVKRLSDEELFASALTNDINLGLGGDAVVRYRASKHIDLQFKGNMAWINNQSFDGITNTGSLIRDNLKYNWITTASIGVVWKIGNKNKRDNLLWAPSRFSPVMAPPVVQEEAPVVYEEVVVQEAPVVVVEEACKLPELPAIHFARNSSHIDVKKYQAQLDEIVSELKGCPTQAIIIEGYCDKTGSSPYNDKLSIKRAESLKSYLLQQGVPAGQIIKTVGKGIDTSLSGDDAFSVKARRAQVENF